MTYYKNFNRKNCVTNTCSSPLIIYAVPPTYLKVFGKAKVKQTSFKSLIPTTSKHFLFHSVLFNVKFCYVFFF